MAHVGSAYPVVFRRDFNLNVNSNFNGWPGGWKFFFLLLPGGRGHALAGHYLYAVPDKYDIAGAIHYRGPAHVYDASFWEAELIVKIDATNAGYDIVLNIYNQATTLVWQVRYNKFFDGPPIPCDLNSPETIYWNPLFWDVQPNSNSIHPFRLLWADYPYPT